MGDATGGHWTDRTQAYVLQRWMSCRLAIARGLLAAGRVDEARAEANDIAKARPNLFDIPGRTVWITQGGGRTTWDAKHHHKELWRAYDTLWWDLQERL